MATNNFVQVPAQSKNLDTNTVTTTQGLVHRQVINLGDPTSATGYVGVTGGALNVYSPTGATETTLSSLVTKTTDGTQKTKITNGTNDNTILQIGTQVTSSNYGMVTNSVIHGLSTGGGGSYVDVKVNPSGSLSVDTGLSQPLTDTQLRASNVNVAINASLPTGSNTIGSIANTTFAATQSGTWNINNIGGTISLPTGASTSALQTTGNTSLASIDSKTPALGQALAASSVPVVLTAAQLTTLTPVSTVTANLGTLNGAALDTSVNSLLKPSSTLSAVTTLGGITNTVTVKADTLVNQTNAFKVDGSATTQPISAVSLPLPTNAATSTNQTTANTSLASIDGKMSSLGQKTMANSQPVVIASDQSAVSFVASPISSSGSLTAVNQSVVVALNGYTNTAFGLSGTWVGTVIFEASIDGGATYPTTIYAMRAGDNVISSTVTDSTNNDIYRTTTGGFTHVRVRCSAYTSGTIVVNAVATANTSGVFLNFPLPSGTNTIGTTRHVPVDLCVTATGAAAAAVTATLPASAGNKHYITKIEIVCFASAARVAGAAPVLVTTTNITGSPVFNFQANAAAQGTSERQDINFVLPLVSTTANTATTIVCPATTSVIWRVNVYYYLAP